MYHATFGGGMGSGLGRKCEQVLGQVDRHPGKLFMVK